MKHDTVIIIPARYASSRFPGKPLVRIRGATGEVRSLIERTWRAATEVDKIDAIYIATDDDRIADAALSFGANVVMTDTNCANGTERCADAIQKLGIQPGVVVNLQGDAPLTPPWFITSVIDQIKSGANVATPILRLSARSYTQFVEDRRVGLVGGTTVVLNNRSQALYFSKEVLPYTGREYCENNEVPVFQHIGVYAYTSSALLSYSRNGVCLLEKLEGLEQLRFLYNGSSISCVEVQAGGRAFWELNNPHDTTRIESILLNEGRI